MKFKNGGAGLFGRGRRRPKPTLEDEIERKGRRARKQFEEQLDRPVFIRRRTPR